MNPASPETIFLILITGRQQNTLGEQPRKEKSPAQICFQYLSESKKIYIKKNQNLKRKPFK
jgi:hypothetical protein